MKNTGLCWFFIIAVSYTHLAGVGIKINTDQANKKIFFEQIMKQMKHKDEVHNISWSKDYRIMDIALNFLLYTEEKVLISDLGYKYFVSRSSIVNDLSTVEESFRTYHIELKKEKDVYKRQE